MSSTLAYPSTHPPFSYPTHPPPRTEPDAQNCSFTPKPAHHSLFFTIAAEQILADLTAHTEYFSLAPLSPNP